MLAAHREGKPGISFGRYGDSPERNGIPAKSFAIVATDDLTLEEGMAKYEPKEVDITIAWTTRCAKAWSPGPGMACSLSIADQAGRHLDRHLARRAGDADRHLPPERSPYKLAIVKGIPSFSGLWVYKDDHTDVRVLGAIAKVLPELVHPGFAEGNDPGRWRRCAEGHVRAAPTIVFPSTVPPDRAIPRSLTSSICPSGMRCATASRFPTSLRPQDERPQTPQADSSPRATPPSKNSRRAPCGRC